MHSINIQALKISTRIGVYEWEQRILQTLLIDIHLPVEQFPDKDDIKETIDYDLLCQKITSHVESRAYKLIETVASEIAGLLQNDFSQTSFSVKVSKPHAVKNAGNISVTFTC